MTDESSESVETGTMPTAEFAFPGPLRDRLVGAILAGKRNTCGNDST
ncbi:MAG: hypothetical protein QOF98_2445 [Streptomyces sp.]|jgi:hypothetical protein|nr:hypothetical protein [Streptomyces sp.]